MPGTWRIWVGLCKLKCLLAVVVFCVSRHRAGLRGKETSEHDYSSDRAGLRLPCRAGSASRGPVLRDSFRGIAGNPSGSCQGIGEAGGDRGETECGATAVKNSKIDGGALWCMVVLQVGNGV